MEPRLLIVNGDDFGLSEETNRGIIVAHERGIVTATSLMVRGAAAEAAASYACSRPQLDIGIHLDMGEWVCEDGEWRELYQVVPLDDALAVRREVDRQLAEFHRLVGKPPTHIDSHQHVHKEGPMQEAATRAAVQLGVPLRHATQRIAYCGRFYGQTGEGDSLPELITVEALVQIIHDLAPGVTELACHPGFDQALPTMYRRERALEVEALCDPRVRAAIDEVDVVLTRFSLLESARTSPSRESNR